MPKHRSRVFILACAAVVGLSLCADAQPPGVTDLGTITVPADFEHGTRVLLRGEYRLAISRGVLVLICKDPSDGLEYSWGLETTADEAKEERPQASVNIAVVPVSGQSNVRIQVLQGKKSYTAMLRVSDEKTPRPVVKGTIDPAIEIELDLLREAHAVLRAYAAKIWPGWTGYQKLDYLVQFPNRATLIVTSRDRVPQLFASFTTPAFDGRRVYLDLSKVLPDPISGPLSIGAHGDISGVTANLTGPLKKAGVPSEGTADAAARGEDAMRLTRLLTYVHEAFHCLQAEFSYRREKAGLNKARGRMVRSFEVDLQYNVLAEIEGDALLRASMASDRASALAFLKDSFVARELRHAAMPPGAVVFEQLRTRDEGAATFATLEAATLLKTSGRPSGGARNARLLDAVYAKLDEYIRKESAERLDRVKRDSDGTSDRYYVYGAYQVMDLDKVFPEWRKGLFEQDRTIDEALSELLALTPADRDRAAERFAKIYDIDGVRGRHAGALKAREDAIEAIRTRKGRTYRIDVSQAQSGFDINPRPGAVFRGREQLYPFGLISFKYGSLLLVSKETPMRMDGNTVEWIDTEAETGAKGYELTYGEKDGDLFKNVTLTTRGFTMTAKAVRIVEDSGVVKIQIID